MKHLGRGVNLESKGEPMPEAIHAHEDDLELYTRGRLEPRHISTVESHLIECATCQERLSQCVGLLAAHLTGFTKPQKNSKRSEPRFKAGDDAVLQEISPLSLDRQKVEIVDISRKGLGLLAPKPIFPGTIVQIRIKNSVELGEVRHCSACEENGYRIGLRLQA